MKVTFRLPSKKIQYGYAEIEYEASNDTDARTLGIDYAEFVLKFQTGEIDAVAAVQDEMAAAEKLLKEELGATKISEEDSKPASQVHESAAQDGADELSHSEKASISSTPPWDKPAPQVDKKPWEQGAPQVNLF